MNENSIVATFVHLDVRPLLKAGKEPFGKIMETLAGLGPGEGLRLHASFEPVPLMQLLGSKGFTHQSFQIVGGDWEILFYPSEAAPGEDVPTRQLTALEWPEPVRLLDNRDLDPHEPM